eukprot:3026741-Rhodomonas_salina.1
MEGLGEHEAVCKRVTTQHSSFRTEFRLHGVSSPHPHAPPSANPNSTEKEESTLTGRFDALVVVENLVFDHEPEALVEVQR